MSNDNGSRAVWGSKLGFLMAAVGSAVGLGNIWRFSYMTYKNGGGAFLVPYIVALFAVGIPLVILEYTMGHKWRGSSPLAFAKVSKKWEAIGWWMPTVATVGIMLFYAVVIAWCMNYFVFSFNDLAWGTNSGDFFYKEFLELSSGPMDLGGFRWSIVATTALVWFICWFICFKEVNHGIEKACSIFMPLLFILTLVLVAWSFTLPGASDGIKAYLTPDWKKVATIGPWIDAFGQIFFSLSLGFGIMITYASYLPEKTNLYSSAIWTAVLNCSYSFVTGFAVFGTLGFMAHTKGVDISAVAKGGPGLAFVVYPEAISSLPQGKVAFGCVFFLTLIIAGLSSGVSLIEAFTCSIMDKFNWTRTKTTTTICVLGFLGSLVFTTRAGLYILDIVDHFINHYALVLGGLLECILVGWVWKACKAREHINEAGQTKMPVLWDFMIKFLAPMILVIILQLALFNDFSKPYEGYSVGALIFYGVQILIMTLLAAVLLSKQKWEKGKLDHKPEDETLLT